MMRSNEGSKRRERNRVKMNQFYSRMKETMIDIDKLLVENNYAAHEANSMIESMILITLESMDLQRDLSFGISRGNISDPKDYRVMFIPMHNEAFEMVAMLNKLIARGEDHE